MKDNRNVDQIIESWTDDPRPSAPAMIQDAIDEAADPAETALKALEPITTAFDTAGGKLRKIIAGGNTPAGVSQASKDILAWRKTLAKSKEAIRKSKLREDADDDDDAMIDEDASKDAISAATDLMGNGTGIGNTAKMFINAIKTNFPLKAVKEFKTMMANMAKIKIYIP